MRELVHKKGWVPKNSCFRIVMLDKTLESPLNCKEIKPVNPKGNQPWIFVGRTDAEAPVFWPPGVKSWLIGKDLDAGKGWRQKEKGAAEDEMVRYHHWSMDMSLSKLWEIVVDRGAWRAAVCGIVKNGTQLGDKQQRIEENGFSLSLVCVVSLSSLFSSFFSHFLTAEKRKNKTVDLVQERDEIV